jgi:hypothetical protein
MKRKIMLLMLVCSVLFCAAPVPADDGSYVIVAGGRGGTPIHSVPYTMSSPGLYYLAGNLTATTTALIINASDVTLDLMGYSLTGPGKDSGSNIGIQIQPACSNVEIRNGSVKSFGNFGVHSSDPTAAGIRVIGLRVRDTGNSGISLYGNGHLATGCSVQNAGNHGIFLANNGSLCKGNQVSGSSGDGIYVSAGIVTGNVCLANNNGFHANGVSSVLDNEALNNTAYGIITSDYCTITRNTARGNPSGGIQTSSYCTITNNTTQGLNHGGNCTLADNTNAP